MKGNDVMVLDKGVLLPSVGSTLLQLYEEEFGDLRSMDLDYLMEWLPRVLVEDLQIAEGMEMAWKGEKIHVKLTASAFRHVCQHLKGVKMICETTGKFYPTVILNNDKTLTTVRAKVVSKKERMIRE